MNEEKYCCWLNTDELILSFHPVVGFLLKEFASSEELLDYVFMSVEREHYRVQ